MLYVIKVGNEELLANTMDKAMELFVELRKFYKFGEIEVIVK